MQSDSQMVRLAYVMNVKHNTLTFCAKQGSHYRKHVCVCRNNHFETNIPIVFSMQQRDGRLNEGSSREMENEASKIFTDSACACCVKKLTL